MKYILVIPLLFLASILSAQEYVYANVANLIMRSRPAGYYDVAAILQPGAKLKIEHKDYEYEKNKEINARFYQVSILYTDPNGVSNYTNGWVMKKYAVTSLDKVTAPVDQNVQIITHSADANNFPPPKYKGGDPPTPHATVGKRVYRLGPKGGCYYIGGTGRKVYVDKKFCH